MPRYLYPSAYSSASTDAQPNCITHCLSYHLTGRLEDIYFPIPCVFVVNGQIPKSWVRYQYVAVPDLFEAPNLVVSNLMTCWQLLKAATNHLFLRALLWGTCHALCWKSWCMSIRTDEFKVPKVIWLEARLFFLWSTPAWLTEHFVKMNDLGKGRTYTTRSLRVIALYI